MATGEDHLEGHGALELDLPGLVDDAHATAAEFFEDLIAWRCQVAGGHGVGGAGAAGGKGERRRCLGDVVGQSGGGGGRGVRVLGMSHGLSSRSSAIFTSRSTAALRS